jgi:acetolactate synthase-1/2/3 large subunit
VTGSEYLAHALERYGVSHVFFVPTILSETLFQIEERTQIERILTHGEKAAAYMADGYARASGRVGVCLAQMVGAANLASGLRDAYLGCAPVLGITGGPYAETRDRNAYQENDDLTMFPSVTKFSARVDSAERLASTLAQAFRSATSGKPGPVHLEFAGHFGEVIEEGEARPGPEPDARFGRIPPLRPCADEDAIAKAAVLLTSAKRPIIVAGGGVRSSGAEQTLRQLAEELAVPVATSLNAKDVLPGAHPLNVGVVGLYSRKSANQAVLESDLVFFVGSKTGSQVTHSWRIPPEGRDIIHLDIDPAELGRNYATRAALCGDARATLERLCGIVDSSTAATRKPWVARVSGYVQEWRDENLDAMTTDSEPVRPERVCGALTDQLPDDALVVADTGHAGMWVGGMLDLRDGQRFIRTAGSLGWGLPASIGAQLAQPDRPVVLFTGDGGFYYHLSELETAARWRVPVVFVVNNNRSLNQEVEVYEPAYGGELHGRHHELWQFTDVDFAKVAESLGVRGIRVTRGADLPSALDEALSARAPVVLDVATDIEAMAPLAFLPEAQPTTSHSATAG